MTAARKPAPASPPAAGAAPPGTPPSPVGGVPGTPGPVPAAAVPGEGDKATAGTGSTGRSWTIRMPPGIDIVTGNNRLHYHAKNKRIAELHRAVATLAAKQRIPQLGVVEITVTYHSPPRRRADRHPFSSDAITDHDGIAPTSKALIDGLVDCGVLRADTKRWVRPPLNRLADQTHPRGQVVITITEVTG